MYKNKYLKYKNKYLSLKGGMIDQHFDTIEDRPISIITMGGDNLTDILLSNFNYDFLVYRFFDQPMALIRQDGTQIYNDNMSKETNIESLEIFIKTIDPKEKFVSYMNLGSVTNLPDLESNLIISVNDDQAIIQSRSKKKLYYINFTYLQNFNQANKFQLQSYSYEWNNSQMKTIRKVIFPDNDTLWSIPRNFCLYGVKKLDLSKLNRLKEISYEFMYQCENLVEVLLPPSLTTILFDCLCKCTNLKLINIDQLQYLKSIGINFLSECPNIKSLNMNNLINLKTIGSSFLGKSKIIKLDLRNSLLLIHIHNEFMHHSNELEEIFFPKSIKRLGSSFLINCPSLKTINIDDLTNLSDIGDNFLSGTGIISIDLRKLTNLVKIPNNFMNNCKDLKELYLPSSIEEIGNDFLKDCPNITTINFNELPNIKKLGSNFNLNRTYSDYVYSFFSSLFKI